VIKKLLTDVSKELWSSENRTSNLAKYARLQKDPGWIIHQKLLIIIANKMAEYLMSAKYTNLNIEDKDPQQRACYYTKEIIDFLIEPLKGIKNHIRAETMGTTTGQPKRKPQRK
jgi:hypothetical protein